MSHINIRRQHTLSRAKIRDLAENVATDLDNRFSLHHYWDGDTLFFKRSGVNGRMDITSDSIHISARLGLLLLPLKARFEQAIHDYLDDLTEEA
ncbi:MAG: polyhydroxyalkanoic acid system family protein [Candidatus Competibacteraceae bacterium]|jgi:putative polyhydroxyalkanoate system protein|nr:polyhydroxyalkanoic acid system family protein [Candidatus Competibacteraceae bacterium]